MAGRSLPNVLQRVRTLAAVQTGRALSDRELLERFVAANDGGGKGTRLFLITGLRNSAAPPPPVHPLLRLAGSPGPGDRVYTARRTGRAVHSSLTLLPLRRDCRNRLARHESSATDPDCGADPFLHDQGAVGATLDALGVEV